MERFLTSPLSLHIVGASGPPWLVPRELGGQGWGMSATLAHPAPALLVRVPQQCLITTHLVRQSQFGRFIEGCADDGQSALALFLLAMRPHARDEGGGLEVLPSSLALFLPYITALTAISLPPRLSTWDTAHLSLLVDPSLVARAQAQAQAEGAAFRRVLAHAAATRPEEVPLGLRGLTEWDWEWARGMVATRAVYLEAGGYPGGEDERAPVLLKEDVYALAPWADLFNHSPAASTRAGWVREVGGYEFWSEVGVGEGEVHISYGAHDNAALLLHYGFCLPANPFNTLTLTPPAPTHPRLAPAQAAAAAALGAAPPFVVAREELPYNLLCAWRLLLATPEELRRWRNLYLEEPLSPDNDRLVARTLEHEGARLGAALEVAEGRGCPSPGPTPCPHCTLARSYRTGLAELVSALLTHARGLGEKR